MLKDLVQYCVDFFSGTFLTWNAMKSICFTFFGFLFAFLGASTGAYFLLCMLILVDFLMALIVLAKTGERFHSRGVWRLAEKFTATFLILLAVQSAQSTLYLPFAAQLTAAAMVASQLVSILEHAAVLGIVVNIPLLKTLKKVRYNNK